MQQHLQLGQAIKIKEKHIAEDEEMLSTKRQQQAIVEEEIDSITSQISTLVLDQKSP